MKNVKPVVVAVTAVSIIALLLGIGTVRVKADKPSPHKPVPATDTVLVKKVTLKGGRPAGVGGKKSTEAATGVLGTPLSSKGTRYAIVVGISDYPGTDSDLEYADDDADEMTLALTDVYGFRARNVTTLKDMAATRSAILAAIDAVQAQAHAEDEVVFFFSGHGMNGFADDGDAEQTDEAIVSHDGTNFLPIWDGELQAAFAGFETSRIVFIFDSCLAGGMDDLQEPGRVVLMACGERGYSYEGDLWQNGEFTYYFAQDGIGLGEANIHDYNTNGAVSESQDVTIEEAFDYAKANCRLDRPVIGDSFTNDLLP